MFRSVDGRVDPLKNSLGLQHILFGIFDTPSNRGLCVRDIIAQALLDVDEKYPNTVVRDDTFLH